MPGPESFTRPISFRVVRRLPRECGIWECSRRWKIFSTERKPDLSSIRPRQLRATARSAGPRLSGKNTTPYCIVACKAIVGLDYTHSQTVPRSGTNAALLEGSSGSMAEESPKRILVVDDEPSICRILTDLLTLDGHAVHIATTPGDAIELCRTRHFDLVFLDFYLPEMTGDKLIAIIKRSSPRQKIVLMTGQRPIPRI